MTSQHPASSSDPAAGIPAALCRRPGCGQPLPAPGRGRTRQFCSDDCARRYHNDARLPAPPARARPRQFCSDDCARRYHNDARLPAPATGTGSGSDDPLDSLDVLTRQAAVLIKTAREQAASLDPARVRAQIAEAEAARRRAEAAAVTADARAAEAEAETQALTEALTAARDTAGAAETAARQAAAAAQATQDELARLRRDSATQITA